MIRRSFRLGVTLGLVCGVALALIKMLGGRSARQTPVTVPSQPWPPLRTDPVTTGAAGAGPRPGASDGTAPASTAPLQQPASGAGGATGPQAAPGPQATRPRPPDEVVGPADEVPASAEAPAARRAKKAPLKAAPAPTKKAPLKAKPATSGKAAGAAPKKAAKRAKKAAPATAWVVPDGDVCPTSHPVKAKMASKIFHVPGMLNYLRTRPDRCYADAQAAEADGLRPAKR